MVVNDFMMCTGELEKFNYVLIDDNQENILELKKMGCTEEEIEMVRSEGELEVYTTLKMKGYEFTPERGFYKP